VLLCLGVLLLPAVGRAGLFDAYLDPVDGQFDTSDWLLNRRGVLPVPIIVTEPAIGFGGGAALLWFHKSKRDEARAEAGEVLGLPPSVTAIVGLATENGTWAAGAGHFASLLDDRLRIRAAADTPR
jgi:hypothetical protein